MLVANKRMSSGKYINMADFKVEDVDLFDINQALNCLYRFTGHHKDKKPLTVAQHTWLTVELSKMMFPGETEVELACLLHDMPEAYYGDLATPWKKILGPMLKELQYPFDKAVHEALWLSGYHYDEEVHDKMKACDLASLDIERRNLWKSQYGKDKWPETPSLGLALKEKEEWFDEAQRIEFVDLEAIWKSYQ